MIVLLAREANRPGIILGTVLAFFFFFGVVDTEELLAGFSNKGMITVALLFLVSEGISQSGGLNLLTSVYLPKRKCRTSLLLSRIMLPASFISAFMNNTPVVVILAPAIKHWAERLKLNSSRFLIPLSYATIMGGTCTLIGTSTNLVVHGLMLENGYSGFTMFELAQIGLPLTVIGTIYVSILGYRFLGPNSSPEQDLISSPKEYLIEMKLDASSPLCLKTVKDAGLRDLSGVFLSAIERNNQLIGTVNHDEVLMGGDRLLFTGNTSAIDDLKSLPGMTTAEESRYNEDFQAVLKHTVEVVVSPRFPGLGKTIKEFNFRATYRAVVLAVHRNGERICSRIGDIRLKPGDNLVLLTTKNFTTRWKNSQDFYMVSQSSLAPRQKPQKALFSLVLLLVLIVGGTFGPMISRINGIEIDIFFSACAVVLLMIWTRCFEPRNYTRYISWDVLITIACAFGISAGLINSGTASYIAETIISALMKFGPVGILGGIYLMTMLFTETVSNNAAAALMFPIALLTAEKLQVDPKPFFVAITIAASASFSTPIGYQTNLIVQGIGNYRFKDFVKIGLPLNMLSFILSILLIPVFWSFSSL